MKNPLLSLSAVLAASALALTACGGGGDGDRATEGDTGSASPAAEGDGVLAVVEHMYGPTEVLEPEDGELRVVALGWSDAEIALALGVEPIAVHDWQSFGEESHGVGPWAADLFDDVDPEVIPRTDGDLDYEYIQSLAPDLILNVNSGYDEAEYNRLSEIAPTISGPEGAANYNPGWEKQTQLVADALGLSAEGTELIEETHTKIEEAREAHPEFEGVEAITGSKFGEAYGLNLSGDMRWDILELLGFQMYAPADELNNGEDFYADISEEQVEIFDADVAVLYPIGYTLEELQADPLISSLDVVQEDRAVFLEGDSDLSMAFSAGSPLSIELVLEELTPQLAEAVENLD
ncbi:iron-siderophore ABC transporter substrate-binding protein [Nesterenkonia massiliensis]|uniref:Iron-siderophore ABC transporter substrate-binding protein n=1 Tax=Nesterenkonia massiliensis TaxID=1232429 RepID=A0ABT2HS16_9MICC|nr:iron-siderophore ABC transporter substrate-binding protein [Nesterenkonia massiliensis]MCT1607499.1 iron-siderophore ABC transporter substrate-binding protein [Nesterenkonia massiliensis]